MALYKSVYYYYYYYHYYRLRTTLATGLKIVGLSVDAMASGQSDTDRLDTVCLITHSKLSSVQSTQQ